MEKEEVEQAVQEKRRSKRRSGREDRRHIKGEVPTARGDDQAMRQKKEQDPKMIRRGQKDKR